VVSPSSTPATTTSAPPATRTPGPASSQNYTVVAGDTLSAIAARFGTTVDAIAELNALADTSLISIGQVLRIP
jgi:LysM repeat protein